MTPAQKLRTLIRYTDILTFFDQEDTERVRVHIKTRGRAEHPTMLEGDVDDVVERALAIVGAGLPRDLKPSFEREMALFSFPTFEEYLRMFDDIMEAYSAPIWFERYERSKSTFLEFGLSPPPGARVVAFNPRRYGDYRSYTIEVASPRDGEPERLFLRPYGNTDPDIGWFIPKAGWWRFIFIYTVA